MIQAQQAPIVLRRIRISQHALSIGSLIASIASLSCCVVPFGLFLAGISGAWIANLTALAPYKPVFVTSALVMLGTGFYVVYRRPRSECAEGSYCASPASRRLSKTSLWIASALVAISLSFPYVVRLIYSE